ncbi:hypothetical protein WS68_04415 [Burkholderia sp. TSV86]|nr:hypothetical protein WS68_04415 [Burkholderia sp. TSV86]
MGPLSAQPFARDGNVARGRVCIGHASSTFAHSEEHLFACVCTHNRVMVEISDAILVTGRTHLQEVKKTAGRLKSESGAEALAHRTAHCPWGYYDSVDSA